MLCQIQPIGLEELVICTSTSTSVLVMLCNFFPKISGRENALRARSSLDPATGTFQLGL
jgi:hypothetical protein